MGLNAPHVTPEALREAFAALAESWPPSSDACPECAVGANEVGRLRAFVYDLWLRSGRSWRPWSTARLCGLR